MKKLLIGITMFFTLCIASQAHAGIILRTDTAVSIFGDTFKYNYILITEKGSANAMEGLGNDYLSFFINLPGITSGNQILFFTLEEFGNVLYLVSFHKLAISSVPLPAALPMFGMALIGLGFYHNRRKKIAA